MALTFLLPAAVASVERVAASFPWQLLASQGGIPAQAGPFLWSHSPALQGTQVSVSAISSDRVSEESLVSLAEACYFISLF